MSFRDRRIISGISGGRSVVVDSPEYQRLKASGNLIPRPEIYSLGAMRREAQTLMDKHPAIFITEISMKDTQPMWIAPILAFDNHTEAKQYYKGIIEKTFKKGPFDCSEDYSDECQKEVLTAYLTVLACPKDSRNLMNIGLIKDADAGLCMLVNYSCDSIYAEDYNAGLLLETLGDDSYPFGTDEYAQISQEKPMWSFQNRRDYLVDVLAEHTTIPLETLKGLDGVKMLRNPKGLVEWCKILLDKRRESYDKARGLCLYAGEDGVEWDLDYSFRVFLNPVISCTGSPRWVYPFGGRGEYDILKNFKAPWEEPKRKAFLQRIVRYYEGQSDWIHSDDTQQTIKKPKWQYVTDDMVTNTKGIGDHQDYQTYLKERKEWCKGPKEYIERWQRAYVYGAYAPQTVFANSFEPLYVKA